MSITMDVEVETLLPIHLGSGKADVIIDSEVAHDVFGMPYFSAKRFKGILYESALEIVEMSELSGSNFAKRETLDALFHREDEEVGNRGLQMIIDDFHIAKPKEYEDFCSSWQQLQKDYPSIINPNAVLEEYTSIRYQTSMEDGIAKHGSLHNMRVVDAGVKFFGRIVLKNHTNEAVGLIALAIRNLRLAGMKRNRGFGKIECHFTLESGGNEQNIIEKIFREAV